MSVRFLDHGRRVLTGVKPEVTMGVRPSIHLRRAPPPTRRNRPRQWRAPFRRSRGRDCRGPKTCRCPAERLSPGSEASMAAWMVGKSPSPSGVMVAVSATAPQPAPRAPIVPHEARAGEFDAREKSFPAPSQKRGESDRLSLAESSPATQPTQSPPALPNTSEHDRVTSPEPAHAMGSPPSWSATSRRSPVTVDSSA